MMKPIEEITEAIGGERWVKISIVRPLLQQLLEEHLIHKEYDSKLTKYVYENRYSRQPY